LCRTSSEGMPPPKNFCVSFPQESGRHNHPGYEVLFVATKGSFDVVLDDGEKHLVRDGDTLKFGGNVYISGTARENAAATIILIKEAEQPKAAEPQ